MTTPDASAGPAGYTVKFGRVARTIYYVDAAATFEFTFDIGPKQGARSTFILEHHQPAARTDEYLLAFKRTKQYMESCGYNVEEYGA
jgi:hypothetical protein